MWEEGKPAIFHCSCGTAPGASGLSYLDRKCCHAKRWGHEVHAHLNHLRSSLCSESLGVHEKPFGIPGQTPTKGEVAGEMDTALGKEFEQALPESKKPSLNVNGKF